MASNSRARGAIAWLGAAAVAGALAAPACSAPGKGSLVLAISTDMQTPKDINIVSVFITTDSAVKFDYLGRVLPDGTVSLPSTLAIVEPDNPSAQVRIRVIALEEQKARLLRDVLTTVPHQRTALLRVPLNFLDDGSGMGMLPAQFVPLGSGGTPEGDTQFDPDTIASACDFSQQQTSINGACASATVDSSSLPDYTDSKVYGAGGSAASPACFHVDQCFAAAKAWNPAKITTAADGSCSFPIPAGENGDHWNCALATTDGTGTCFGGKCFVPLESDPGEGFSIQPGKAIVMVPGVCKKLAKGAALYVDQTSCATKAEAAPVCEPTGGGPGRDSGVLCQGAYTMSCGSGTCVSGNCQGQTSCPGGSATFTIEGTMATTSNLAGNDSGSIAGTLTGTVDPSTCTATFSIPSFCDGGAATPWTFDLGNGTVTAPVGVASSSSDGGGSCSVATCQYTGCTVTAGNTGVDAGPADAGPPGNDAALACPQGIWIASGVGGDATPCAGGSMLNLTVTAAGSGCGVTETLTNTFIDGGCGTVMVPGSNVTWDGKSLTYSFTGAQVGEGCLGIVNTETLMPSGTTGTLSGVSTNCGACTSYGCNTCGTGTCPGSTITVTLQGG